MKKEKIKGIIYNIYFKYYEKMGNYHPIITIVLEETKSNEMIKCIAFGEYAEEINSIYNINDTVEITGRYKYNDYKNTNDMLIDNIVNTSLIDIDLKDILLSIKNQRKIIVDRMERGSGVFERITLPGEKKYCIELVNNLNNLAIRFEVAFDILKGSYNIEKDGQNLNLRFANEKDFQAKASRKI